jgi:hypothetical protein
MGGFAPFRELIEGLMKDREITDLHKRKLR